MAKLLILDSDEKLKRKLEALFRSRAHEVHLADDGAQLLENISTAEFDCILCDGGAGKSNSLQLLRDIKSKSPNTPVLLTISSGTVDFAVAAMRAGAYDCIVKPFSFDHIVHEVERALEFRTLQVESLSTLANEEPLLESNAPVMQRIFELAERAADSDAAILLIGESGTGKKMLARQIHRWSRRSANPFMAVNCAGLRDNLLESELFGHERGAFAGAVDEKSGRIELANHGTLFLDQISNMTPRLQISLLHFIKERSFQRVGGERKIAADVRLIAASNPDLGSALASHQFRDDLYYRLGVITLEVPPLREHSADIGPLAERMLTAAAIRYHRSGVTLSEEAANALARYQWPGNILELRNAVEHAVVLCREEAITPEHLPKVLRQNRSNGLPSTQSSTQRR